MPSDAELWEIMQLLALKHGGHQPRDSAIAMARTMFKLFEEAHFAQHTKLDTGRTQPDNEGQPA